MIKEIWGERKDVQIDKILFNRRKFKKKPSWVFGVIIGGSVIFFHNFPDRTDQTFNPLLN